VNNGIATSNGYVASGSLTYGFSITSGTMNKNDIGYVGGSSMTPSGTKLRVIDIATTSGDQFGSSTTTGVLGNGGSNADSVAVFSTSIASLTASTVPVDAIWYGTGIGFAVPGSGGYQLPNNDRYSGGKLQSTSFFAPDPTNDGLPHRATAGVYQTSTGTWTTSRTWLAGQTSSATPGFTVA